MSVVDLNAPNSLIYSDPQLLGEMLALWSHASFVRGPRQAIYECNQQNFRFVSGGSPFRVDVFAIQTGGDVPVFNVMSTGDGLTFDFSREKLLDGVALMVQSGARDQAVRMRT